MREFKPMVKMETTEPTVELKLKKGGAVKKMAGGGAPMGAMIGAPKGGMMAGAKPKKPSLAARRRAMMASGAAGAPSGRAEAMMAAMPPSMPAMKKGGEMESPKVHKAEMKELSGIKKELTKHEDMPASKGHRGLKTGGVVNGNGGFKTGGAAKKFAEGGRVQHDGGPEQMKQGKKKPAGPVSINQLSGTYKKGGAVMMAAGGSTQSANAQKAAAARDAVKVFTPLTPQMASMQKASTEKAAAARANAQKAAAEKAMAQKAAQKAAQEAAFERAKVKPNVGVSQPATRLFTPLTPQMASMQKASTEKAAAARDAVKVFTPPTPQVPKPKIAGLDPKTGRFAPGSMEYDPNSPVNRPTVSVSQPSAPQPNDDGGSGYGTGSVGMRRGGKVQNNGKKRGGAVC